MKISKKIKGYEKHIATAFFISMFLMGVPLVISDFFPAADNFFETHVWLFYIFFLPIGLYGCVFVVLTFIVLAQLIFEEYHKDRESGSSSERALLKVFIIVAFLALLGFCSRGSGRWID